MATETKTIATPYADTQCASIIFDIDNNAKLGASLKVKLAQAAIAIQKREGWTREDVRTMLVLSWRDGLKFKPSKEENREKEERDFDNTYRFDVSKIMSLAFPADDKAQGNLDAAIKHNEKLGKLRGRIGENRLLDISRGKLTFEDARRGLSVKKIRTAAKAKQDESFTAAAEDTKVPVPQRFANAVKAIAVMFKLELDQKSQTSIAAKAIAGVFAPAKVS